MTISNLKKIQWSFEVVIWLVMRISGIVLLLLAGLSIIQVEILTGIENITAQWLQIRWRNPLWQGIDFLTAVLVILHGFNGLRYMLCEIIPLRPLRRLVNILVIVAGCIVVLGCVIVIF